jgi:hypothetical protein
MGRRIVSEQLQSGAANVPPDDYASRLMKYIPTEGVGFWLAVSGVIQSTADDVPKVGILWLFFAIGLVLTFLWIKRTTQEPGKPTAWTQVGISCGAFIVWVIATGGPLVMSLPFYKPFIGSLLLITYTAFVAYMIPPEK